MYVSISFLTDLVLNSCELWSVGQEFFLFDSFVILLYTVFAYIGEFCKKEMVL